MGLSVRMWAGVEGVGFGSGGGVGRGGRGLGGGVMFGGILWGGRLFVFFLL